MLTAEQISQNMLTQARLSDPVMSGEIGTPERKIFDAVAEVIAANQVDFSVLNQQHDISSMTGGRLDAYLTGIFAFGRQSATPSFGTVTFSRSTAATEVITIPRGTQVQASIDNSILPTLIYVTLDTCVIDIGETSTTAPAQCALPGTVGNIDANKITGFAGLRTVPGVTSVSNPSAFTGGTDGETDDEYRVRFGNTFLRNLAGTNDNYLALAVSVNGVTKANVIGPISRYQEYIQVPNSDDANQVTPYDAGGTLWTHKRTSAESTIPYSKYTYPTNYYLTNSTLDPSTSYFFRPGVDFVFNAPPWNGATGAVDSSNPHKPNVTFLTPTTNPDLAGGTVLFFEHAYISLNSRNDYTYGILNCVDVFINGENPQAVTSNEVVPSTSTNLLQSSTATLWTYQHPAATTVINFKRKIDGTSAAVGSLVIPLYWQPVLEIPDSIQIGTSTYYRANYYNSGDSTYYNQYDGTTYSVKAHYALVQEVNGNFGTVRSRDGIEFFLSGNNYLKGALSTDTPSSYNGAYIDAQVGTEFTVENYTYDQNVSNLQAIMDKNKQTGDDILVHRTMYRYFRPIVTVMYDPGASQAVVNSLIESSLAAFFENHYYGTAIQLSDILQVIHNVPGIDNVRWTNENTGTNKLEEVNRDGSSLSSPTYITADFYIQDNQLAASPESNAVTITVRAANTWGT